MAYELERGERVTPINPNRSDAPDPSIRVGRDRWPPSRGLPCLFPPAWPLIALCVRAVTSEAAIEAVEHWGVRR